MLPPCGMSGIGTPLTGSAPVMVTPFVAKVFVIKLVPNGKGSLKRRFTPSAVPELVTTTV